jgi:hypothetical protein
MTTQDNSAEIADLEAIHNAGAANVSTDGTSVGYDLAAIRKRLAELRANDETDVHRRPRVARILL